MTAYRTKMKVTQDYTVFRIAQSSLFVLLLKVWHVLSSEKFPFDFIYYLCYSNQLYFVLQAAGSTDTTLTWTRP